MKVSQQLQQQWQQSRQQIAANPRLGWGLWCIGLLALLYANFLMSDQRALLGTELRSLYLDQQDAISLSQDADWPARLAQAQQALEQQAARFGTADSEALARAEMQASLGQLLQRHQIERGRVDVSAAAKADANTGLVPLQVQITGRPAGDQLLALLAELEQGPLYYRIDNVTATQGPRNRYVSFTLLATAWYHPWGQP